MPPEDPRTLVSSWFEGRARVGSGAGLELAPRRDAALARRCRRAYDWISREAIVSPYHDIGFGQPIVLGKPEAQVELTPAARAFIAIDHDRLEAVDRERREWVARWLEERGLSARGATT